MVLPTDMVQLHQSCGTTTTAHETFNWSQLVVSNAEPLDPELSVQTITTLFLVKLRSTGKIQFLIYTYRNVNVK